MKIRSMLYLCLTIQVIACTPENTPPSAAVFSIPEVGDSATVFMLDGRNSSDQESSFFVLKYRWDLDADGVWDTDYSSRTSNAARFIKPGFQKYILEVADEDGGTSTVVDSVFILQQNLNSDTLTDSRDGIRYRIVKIGENWWVADNLRFGNQIDFSVYPGNNDRIEYLYFNNSKDFEDYGSLYTWMEANMYPSPLLFRDICPPGWRIPTATQWSDLIKKYAVPFDVLYYFGLSSIENLGVQMHGYYRYGNPDHPMNGIYLGDQYAVRYWTSSFTGQDTTIQFTGMHFSRDSSYFVKTKNRPEWIYHPMFPGYVIGFRSPEACYVKCIKQ